MRHVLTLFDHAHAPPRPLQSLIIYQDNSIDFFEFYLSGMGSTIKQIKEAMFKFKLMISGSGDLCINDYKSHILNFNLEPNGSVIDYAIPELHIKPKDIQHGRKTLLKLALELCKISPQQWQKLLANAAFVYAALESKKIRHNHKILQTKYSLDTFAGRSKTLGFNIQGTTDEYDIRPIHDDLDIFIQFDWLAADLRMAAYMSGDQRMEASFIKSDPYAYVESYLHDPEYNRDQCKSELIKALYALNVNHPIIEIFPKFKLWMIDRLKLMRSQGYLESILGRRFIVEADNELSVFNAQFQGSVVHAMQAALVKIYDRFPKYLFAEVHDSIIMCCNEETVPQIISEVSKIMLQPLDDWVDPAPRMPIKISVGNRWRRWKRLRVDR
jgi:hypothetical protein